MDHTDSAPIFKFFRCRDCGFNGPITTEEIAKHRAHCAYGTTEPIQLASLCTECGHPRVKHGDGCPGEPHKRMVGNMRGRG
jgi:hypothetical protein